MKPASQSGNSTSFFLFPVYFFWRRSRKGAFLILTMTMILMVSCFQHYYTTNTQTSIDANSLQRLQNAKKYFIIHFNDRVYAINNIAVKGDNLEGDLAAVSAEHNLYLNPRPARANRVRKAAKMDVLTEVHMYYPKEMTGELSHISIPISAINRMDVYEFDPVATRTNHVFSWIGTVLASAAVLGTIALAIACNCPQVYVNTNGEYEFKSGVYSGAVYSTLERSDYLALDGINPVNNQYLFRIRNMENEEQHINQVQLLKVTHPRGVKVLADRHGKLFTFVKPVPPTRATSGAQADLTSELQLIDSRYFGFDNPVNENGLSGVTLSFEKPAQATKGKLLIHAGNTKWSGYLYKEFNAMFGSGYDKWRTQQEQAGTGNAQQWQIEQGLPLKVSIETPNGWRYVDHFSLTGNTASRDMIMEIDLKDVPATSVNIKIETVFQFWNLDKVAMDFSEDAIVTTKYMDAAAAVRSDGSSQAADLLQRDKKYAKLTGTEYIDLNYEVEKEEDGKATSLFLLSSGYYYTQPAGEGKADLPSLLRFKEKGEFDKFSRRKYNGIQETLAAGYIPQKKRRVSSRK
ncbi:MAG: hypothetical protein H7Y42_05565 [Chitinophagaceae bacterium]|nr:hypothetical protein [Chitinophagaceae bacterium]